MIDELLDNIMSHEGWVNEEAYQRGKKEAKQQLTQLIADILGPRPEVDLSKIYTLTNEIKNKDKLQQWIQQRQRAKERGIDL